MPTDRERRRARERAREALIVSALTLALGGCGARGPQARVGGGAPREDSITLQARAAREKARFERGVAAEATPSRLAVHSVATNVLVDRARGVVYVLDPTLLALDLGTGAVRWKRDDVRGTSLARAGGWLVALGTESPTRPIVWFVAPDTPMTARACVPALPIPAEAETVSLAPFDRRGATYAFFSSSGHMRVGGTPPTESERKRYEAGRACGVVSITPSSCRVERASTADFLLDPPRDLGALVPIDPTDCRYLSPSFSMPAYAASTAPPWPADATPRLKIVTTRGPSSGCLVRSAVRLEARDASDAVVWSHPLPEETSDEGCPGPP